MTTAFDRALADLMANPDLALAGWWLPRAGSPVAVRLVARVPGLGELQGRAPASRGQRLVDLGADVAAAAGDLLAWDGSTWLVGGHGDPDPLGLTRRWICTAFEGSPAYHASGYPLLSWNGSAWVASP